jgi:hypothetical protein
MNSSLYKDDQIKYYQRFKFIVFLLSAIGLSSCSDSEQDTPSIAEISVSNNGAEPITNDVVSINKETTTDTESTASDINKNNRKIDGEEYDYQSLRYKITYGQAEFYDVRLSLTQEDVGGLTNTVHALYSMRWNRKVLHLIHNLWDIETHDYPKLAWEQIAKTPVRIALASTILRIQNLNPLEHKDSHIYKTFIREHKYDEHEFNRAQVVVALGLAGDPVDVPYLEEMAAADNHYVTQSAITGLGLMNSKQASDALAKLYNKYKDDARADLILEVLNKAYDLHPTTSPPEGSQNKS